ncbi:MAG: hypothetical protein H6581_03945 [Bacteroidia bacterium]|nr:hypothetical protein [Bacteroidia bacterium]
MAFISFPPTPVPTLDLFNFSPASGSPGSQINISVTLLNTQVNGIKFNGTPANFFQLQNGQYTAIVPFGATTGPISLQTGSGSILTSNTNFTVTGSSTGSPSITGLSPLSGPIFSELTINGTNFANLLGVSINGVPAQVTYATGTQIVVLVPSQATSGPVRVETVNGIAVSSQVFTVLTGNGALPGISSFTPTGGSTGTIVTVSGSNFSNVQSVKLGQTSVFFGVFSNTTLQFSVPANATTGFISVTTPAGTATSSQPFVVQTNLQIPTISSFSPTSATVGATVTVNGSGFVNVSQVKLGDLQAGFNVLSPNTLQFQVPMGASTGKITVTTDTGTVVSQASLQIPPVAAGPQIFSFSPPVGNPGTLVSIQGSNFSSVTAVTFNGIPGVITTLLPELVIAKVPEGNFQGKISLLSPFGNATSAGDFLASAPTPKITGFTPSKGAPETDVTLFGENLQDVFEVRFAPGILADLKSIAPDGKSLVTTVPNGAINGGIKVTSPAGFALTPTIFEVDNSNNLRFTSFSPTLGPAGTDVEIIGTGFSTVEEVKFNGKVADFDIIDSGMIIATVPPDATSGFITLRRGIEEIFSPDPFMVTPFALRIDSFNPTSAKPGENVTIFGNAFTSITRVKFNDTPATFQVLSETKIRATVPAGVTKGPLSVKNSQGQTAVSAQEFSPNISVPSISQFTPVSGAPGTQVLITGSGLSNARQVLFGRFDAQFTNVSDTLVRAFVPDFARTGAITVITDNGTAVSEGIFTVLK